MSDYDAYAQSGESFQSRACIGHLVEPSTRVVWSEGLDKSEFNSETSSPGALMVFETKKRRMSRINGVGQKGVMRTMIIIVVKERRKREVETGR